MAQEMTGSPSGRGVLEGAFGLLQVLARHPDGLGLSQVARTAGIPKATAHRLLEQLVELGAAQRIERRYAVGTLMAELGESWRPRPALRRAARSPMSLLSRTSSACVMLSVTHRGETRMLAGNRGPLQELPPLRLFDEFSSDTAAGRVLLHAADADDPATGGRPREWRQERATLARTGWLVAEHGSLSCVAAAVQEPGGATVASLSALVLRPTPPAGLPELVTRAAGEISRNLAAISAGTA
ncbi:helix-turn-helix domain-containing protein [Pseudonocardia sp. CA-107938]|uniref:helix-turn-helix domain-containing protein n=1 Tax=Pseudonocardia sp. CA-107938 TaxID=3240021 RepID=UPI003D8F4174